MVKGITKDLYVGKKEINIITMLSKKITISFADIKRIEYDLAITLKSGYVDFIMQDSKITFEFMKGSNDKIGQMVDFIANDYPELAISRITRKEEENEKAVGIVPTFGFKEIGISEKGATLRQRADGKVYFDNNNVVYYDIVEYEWKGPKYNTVTTSTGQTTSSNTTKTKGKALRVGIGALAIGAVTGGAGAIIGGAMGALSGGKKHTTGTTDTKTESLERQLEESTTASITLKRIDNGQKIKLSFLCNTTIDAKIRCFKMQLKSTSISATKVLNEVKALKELLELGVISEEEFEEKKQMLLDK